MGCHPVAHQLPTGIAEQSGSWKGGFSDEEDEDDEEEADEEEAESNVMKAGDRWELQEEATVQQRSGRLLLRVIHNQQFQGVMSDRILFRKIV